jgi:kynurenine formamidase
MVTRLIDLSHVIAHGTVTYPGFPPPVISDFLSREASREKYAPGTEFQIGRIDMIANTGTYLDTPAHRYADGFDLAELPLAAVAGVPGVVISVVEMVIGAPAVASADLAGKAVLVRTGWDRHWGRDEYGDTDHPHLTAEAAEQLVGDGVALVGIDSVNIDATTTGERPAHSTLLAAGIPIVEHLTGLDQLPSDGFEFFAVPVKVQGMGTFPVRAFARWVE